MAISGKLFIAGEWVNGESGTYQAVNPATNEKIDPVLTKASSARITSYNVCYTKLLRISLK